MLIYIGRNGYTRLKNFYILDIHIYIAIDIRNLRYFQIVKSLSGRNIDQRSALCVSRFPRSRRRPSAVYFLRVHRPRPFFFLFFFLVSTFDGERVRNAVVRNDNGTTSLNAKHEFVSEGRSRVAIAERFFFRPTIGSARTLSAILSDTLESQQTKQMNGYSPVDGRIALRQKTGAVRPRRRCAVIIDIAVILSPRNPHSTHTRD